MSPTSSDDLTIIVEEGPAGTFVVLQSPDSAEDEPDYVEAARFPTKQAADKWRPA
jgi:hypothetical protein